MILPLNGQTVVLSVNVPSLRPMCEMASLSKSRVCQETASLTSKGGTANDMSPPNPYQGQGHNAL